MQRINELLDAERPQPLLLDSIQTVYDPDFQSARAHLCGFESAPRTSRATPRARAVRCFSSGTSPRRVLWPAPKVHSHMVDAELYFEGESGTAFRMLGALKNRFGTVNEIGVFAMGKRGLEEVSNPLRLFLTQHEWPAPGWRGVRGHGRQPAAADRDAGARRARPGAEPASLLPSGSM